MIPFNRPLVTGKELRYIKQVLRRKKLSGDGEFTKKCNQCIEENIDCTKALLTTSGTHALDMAAILVGINPGDEVIMPSYTFVSTANAFVLRGAKIIFVDIRPDTMNIDEKMIEPAISKKTKAIVVVHYAGVSCEMDAIISIAKKYQLCVVEDAAQGLMSKYKNSYLGTIGDIGCFSFHETKNINCGEGGALILNRADLIDRAEIIREKGTNRSKFFRGQIDKYSWVDVGSSYLPSELNAAFLYGQLLDAIQIRDERMRLWNHYLKLLKPLSNEGLIDLTDIPKECRHNAHMFYIKVKNLEERTKMIKHLKDNNIMAVFHYVPLHSSTAGTKFGKFFGKDVYTTADSERLLRLPLYNGLKLSQIDIIAKVITDFFHANSKN